MEHMHTFIINLPDKTDRKQHMINLMNAIGLTNYTFVEPIPRDSLIKPANMDTAQLSLVKTNINILRSEYNQINRGKYVLIFEDDVVINKIDASDVIPSIERAIVDMPSDWDMLYLEYCNEACWVNQAKGTVRKARGPLCTGCMLYQVESIPKILKCLENEYVIDKQYLSCIRQQKLQAFTTKEPLFVQNKSFEGTIPGSNGVRYFHSPCTIIDYHDLTEIYALVPITVIIIIMLLYLWA
jgi:hypothetical protein